jgi:hypothetical protein
MIPAPSTLRSEPLVEIVAVQGGRIEVTKAATIDAYGDCGRRPPLHGPLRGRDVSGAVTPYLLRWNK